MSAVVTLPDVGVSLAGAPLPRELAECLAEIHLAQRLACPAQCELVLLEPPGEAAERIAGASGDALTLEAAGDLLFTGRVTAAEMTHRADGGRELRLRGYDALHRLRKRQPVRAHRGVTPERLAGELVADLGLSVRAATAGPRRELVVQWCQNDLELLVEEAARAGLYPLVAGDELRLLDLGGDGAPVRLELGRELLAARFEVNGDGACREVVADGWDPVLAVARSGRAERPRSGRRVDAAAPPDALGGLPGRRLANAPAASDEAAAALAQAELDRRTAAEVVCEGSAEGDPRLVPGARLELHGVAAPFAGRWVATAVEHRIDADGGWISTFTTEPPAAPPHRPAGPGTWGTVTRVDDPEGLARVRVTLPAFGDVESGWLGVVTAGAGGGKGLLALPDAGDEVLVLFVHGDPAQGVVLGGLYGSRAPADPGVEENSVSRATWTTAGGHRFVLDDAAGTLRLETSGGSFLELGPEAVRLHAAAPLELTAPERPVTVRGARIDFERG